MSLSFDLPNIARALGGEVQGRQVLAPGPGHSRKDRSMSVRLSHQSPTGFITFSHAGDGFAVCRDFVAQKLGMPAGSWKTTGEVNYDNFNAGPRPKAQPETLAPALDNAARVTRAVEVWNQAGDAIGTVVERYLASRGLELPHGFSVIRLHPRCPWRDGETSTTIFVPAMVAALRTIDGDDVIGIHRTRLTAEGVKVDRRMLGQASSAAIKLDADDEVTLGLHIAEGIETALAGRKLGLRPVWALGSAGAIASFPVLPGIEALTLLAEHDAANARAVEQCATRWHQAGREVNIIRPVRGNDLNDAIKPEIV